MDLALDVQHEFTLTFRLLPRSLATPSLATTGHPKPKPLCTPVAKPPYILNNLTSQIKSPLFFNTP